MGRPVPILILLFVMTLLTANTNLPVQVGLAHGACREIGFTPCSSPPKMEMALTTNSVLIGFSVTISGTVNFWNSSVNPSNTMVGVSYWQSPDAFDALNSTYGFIGTTISQVHADQSGRFVVGWLPTVTGTYGIKGVLYSTYGNVEEVILSLQVLPVQNQYVFAVSSNSSVTGLAFNGTSSLLAFNLKGRTGDVARVDVTISKSILPDPTRLKVVANSGTVPFTSTGSGSAWLITFWATFHSAISIQMQILPLAPDYLLYVVVSGVATAAAISVLGYLRIARRRRMGPSVETVRT